MKSNFRYVLSMFAIVSAFAISAFGQETTGSIEVTVRDPQGAAVPNASVSIESVGGTAGFRRNVTTSDQGTQRVLQVPPGLYRISVDSTAGFAAKSVDNVNVVLGKITPVTVDLGLSGTTAVVDVAATENPIDATDSKIQTNITAQTAELLPKGVGFTSLLKISPATRPEPKSGGFQVDGASGSENTFIIDGNEVTNPISGTLDGNNNLPFSIVQEVQVKSSGFEAEYGGATGGVINVVTKGGNNALRGEFGVGFMPGKFQAARRDTLYVDENGDPIHLRYNNIDSESGFFPVASLSGPIIKNKVWFFGSWSPQIVDDERTIPYRPSTGLAPQTYRRKTKSEYGFGRIDAQPISSVRIWSSYIWNPIAVDGDIPALSSQFDSGYPSGRGLEGPQFTDQRGGRQNSNVVTVSGIWTPTSNFIFDARYGRNFLNNKLGTYGLEPPLPASASNTFILVEPNSSNIPVGTGASPGASNGIPWADATIFDATTRETFDTAATFITNFGGRHEFKGGYQYNKIFNTVQAPRNPYIRVYYGYTIGQASGRTITPTPGAIGVGRVRHFGAFGEASSTNDGIYFQDKWQPTRRLTLNLGIRAEKEAVPSFNDFPGIEFGWGDKFAPRIGVAYDLTGDGKTKISGFFGWFYDRFKYELPRGSFGGNVYQDYYFELFDPNQPYDQISAATAWGASVPPLFLGGNCPQTGFVTGQIRCVIDRRVPSNDPSLDVATQGGIDPNILPYRQTELTFTFERELTSKYVFAARYTRKHLDRAIEDIGFLTADGSEAYIIGNPGLGLGKEFYELNDWIPRKAVRDYDAVEVRVDRRFADDYYFNANYTWSRLYGNYSGLASSDENGRTDPNVSRAFDAPFTEATIAGGETRGKLATDRPHVFKFAGAYSLDWNKRFGLGSANTTEFQTFFTAQSGTPLTTYATVAGYNSIVLNKRGDLGRSDFFTQTDFALRHRYKFGRDNRFTLVGEVDVINLFNQNAVTNVYNLINGEDFDLTDPAYGLVTQAEVDDPNIDITQLAERRFQASGAPGILSVINSGGGIPENRYKLPTGYQAPRSLRFGFRFIF
ncbi:MAG: carboxypeptidase regulatory-like domain-containing protein [Pyrinomonadaceae bacterium]